MNTRNRKSILALAAIALVVVAGPSVATAKSPANGTYTAKTENGGKFKFKLKGKKASGISGVVPTVCLETMGSYQSRAGTELFRPTGSFRLGKTGESRDLQPAAMNQGIKATKNYTVRMNASGSGIKGKVKLSYSFLTLGPDPYHSYIWICSSSVDFTARKG